MIGAMTAVVLVGLCTVLAWRPPMPRYSSPFNLRFALGWMICEMPQYGLVLLAFGTAPTLIGFEIDQVLWWVVALGTAFDCVLLVVLAVRMRAARPVLAAAFTGTFGPGSAPPVTRPPWWRIVMLPFVSWRADVRRVANVSYGPSRRGNRLDVYMPRRGIGPGAPVLVYLHPGGFVMGSKKLGAHPLLQRLAASGWLCATVDYRLRGVGYADQLADTRAAIEWVRRFASERGADPDAVFVAGGSAGAHLVATAAMSGTPVRGVIGLYGYYGDVGADGDGPRFPMGVIGPDAPPFLIVHGSVDTLVLPEHAREFAGALAAVSTRPVVYAEIPGMHHNFDFFHSLRFHRICDAIEHFATIVLTSTPATSGRDRDRRDPGAATS